MLTFSSNYVTLCVCLSVSLCVSVGVCVCVCMCGVRVGTSSNFLCTSSCVNPFVVMIMLIERSTMAKVLALSSSGNS